MVDSASIVTTRGGAGQLSFLGQHTAWGTRWQRSSGGQRRGSGSSFRFDVISLQAGWGHLCPLVDGSEIAHQGICHDVSGTRQVIPNDQAQHLGTLSGLVEGANVPISGVGAVGVNQGDSESGCFGLGHGALLN